MNIRSFAVFCALALSTIFLPTVGAQSVQFIPATPKALESVWVRFSPTRFSTGAPAVIRMTELRIEVQFSAFPTPLDPGPPYPPRTIYLGQLPAGVFRVDLIEPSIAPGGTITTGHLTVANASSGAFGLGFENSLTDLWWNAQESGWGVNITVKHGKLFAAWFHYDSAGRAAWLTLQPGAWVTLNCFQGPIYRTTAAPLSGIVGLSNLSIFEAGTGKFCFNDDMNSAVFTYTVDGVTSEKAITRQPF